MVYVCSYCSTDKAVQNLRSVRLHIANERRKKIILVSNDIFTIYKFRLPLIKCLQAKGHKVVAVAPFLKFDSYVKLLKDNKVKCIDIKMDIWGINPLRDIYFLYQLFKIYQNEKPDIIQHYTVKPVIYGTLAARIVGIKNIYNTITGLPFAFTLNGLKYRAVCSFLKALYRVSMRFSSHIFFHNYEDRNLFISNKFVKPEKATVVPTGVDTEFFKSKNVEINNQNFTFLYIGRILKTKGIMEFIEAARRIRQKYTKSRFLILGMVEDGNPLSIEINDLNKWQKEGIVKYLGFRDDVRPYIEEADVVVLPSYREGCSTSLQEACSMSCPIIATDIPGCREVVKDGVNGFLVPIKDVKALTEAMERFILNPHLKISMGREGRKFAVKKFDVQKVNKIILSCWGLL